MRNYGWIAIVLFAVILGSCEKDDPITSTTINEDRNGPTPYYLKIPPGFPDYFLAPENQITEEGIELGRKLFFDPILSKNGNISCGSCHVQSVAFSDSRARSIGTDGQATAFHSMPIFNIAWMNEFFWDGRAKSREAQALLPVRNPVEMGFNWIEATARLKNDDEYPEMFDAAFPGQGIDSNLAAQAMVQYEMTIVSANSKFDRYLRGEVQLTAQEDLGRLIFNTEQGDCFHCHGDVLATNNSFHNNGLDTDADLQPGLYAVTGNQEDFGKFKSPTMRNLAFTAPYMHDGRFATLEEVIDFYSEGVHPNRTVDLNMKKAGQGGVQLNKAQKEALIAFILTMTDSSLIQNPNY